MGESFFEVALPIPVDHPFTYEVPKELEPLAQIGKRVVVTVGRQLQMGYLVRAAPSKPSGPIKAIQKIIDGEPLFGSKDLDFYTRAARYYRFPLGEALKAVLPKAKRFPKEREGKVEKRSSPSLALTLEQEKILDELNPFLEGDRFAPFLLQGVTGSGKTEIYLRATEKILERGKSALVLVPEIALTPQLMEQFRARWGPLVFAYHSGMTAGARFETWMRAMGGVARVVLGTRSAVFVPLQNLGLIIVDEEHDPSYKQEEGFRYNGRDLAIWRSQLTPSLLILGSATPSVESRYRLGQKPWRSFEIRYRVGNRPMAEVSLIDLRNPQTHGPHYPPLSTPLSQAICETFERKEQTLLFLNRRGFSPTLFCEDCGDALECPACSVSLAYHRRESILKCHYCGSRIAIPNQCAQCRGALLPIGQGTERIEEDLKQLIPGIRIARIDRDAIVSRKVYSEIFEGFAHGKFDVLVGTQMITKGLDFPRLTLVGVLDADQSLHFPDFRAAERTFQLLTQVAGRSGRGEALGRVLIQTFSPDHYAIQAASRQDYSLFYEQELQMRQGLEYPPFSRLARLHFSGIREPKVASAAGECAQELQRWMARDKIEGQVELLGPAPALITRVAGRYRYQLVLKAIDRKPLEVVLNRLSQHLGDRPRQWGSCRFDMDIDPQSIL